MPTRETLVDLLERTAATFGQAFLAVVVATNATDLSALRVGATAGAFAVAKYLLVKANSYNAAPAVDVDQLVSRLEHQAPVSRQLAGIERAGAEADAAQRANEPRA